MDEKKLTNRDERSKSDRALTTAEEAVKGFYWLRKTYKEIKRYILLMTLLVMVGSCLILSLWAGNRSTHPFIIEVAASCTPPKEYADACSLSEFRLMKNPLRVRYFHRAPICPTFVVPENARGIDHTWNGTFIKTPGEPVQSCRIEFHKGDGQ
jgi:hypothetical protein